MVNTTGLPLQDLPISDIEASRVVADSQRHRILTVLIERKMTARVLAEHVKIGRTRLYYHLNLLEQYGFIRVVGKRMVSGILERTYRATARQFRVDRALLGEGATEREIEDAQGVILEQAAEDLRSRSGTHDASHDNDVLVARAFMRLSDPRRRELRARLVELFKELQTNADLEGDETELIIALFATERDAVTPPTSYLTISMHGRAQMKYHIDRFARSSILACTSLAFLTGFGPNPGEMNAQVAGLPEVGIVVATLGDGNVQVRSFGAHFDGNSAFEIGSITKTFTAALLADMIRRREVVPDDPIERYLPAGVTAPVYEGRHITLANLATQSSGLPRMPTNLGSNSNADAASGYDATKMFAFLSTYKLQRAPGAQYAYSNYGFGLLGELLARRLKMSYADAIRTRILVPLNMNHTFVEATGTHVHTVGGHDTDGDPVPNEAFEAFAGAGAIVSTGNDMLLYARANLPGATGPLAEAMRDARSPKAAASNNRRIGYAWQTQPDGVIWHNGRTTGFVSFLGLDEARNRAIFVVANANLGHTLDAIGFNALDPAEPPPPTPISDAVVDPKTLDIYPGRYRFSDKSTMTVTHDARGLVAVFNPPGLRARLHPRSSADFVIREPAVDLHFDGADKNMRVTVKQAGQQPDTGTRVP